MQLSIHNEYDQLQELIVCRGECLPDVKTYRGDDEEYAKYHDRTLPWDSDLLLAQQDAFYQCLDKLGVTLHFLPPHPALIWQTYVRDVAFVVGDTLYYNRNRNFKERRGEVDQLLAFTAQAFDDLQTREIFAGAIEGGDVMPTANGFWVGNTGRTDPEAINELEKDSGKTPRIFELGPRVMHLDTRLTQIGPQEIIAYLPAFTPADQHWLQAHFYVHAIDETEMKRLASNVFVVNPEHIIVESRDIRLADSLRARGWQTHLLEYSEPIKLGGSFRCTTLPLFRG